MTARFQLGVIELDAERRGEFAPLGPQGARRLLVVRGVALFDRGQGRKDPA